MHAATSFTRQMYNHQARWKMFITHGTGVSYMEEGLPTWRRGFLHEEFPTWRSFLHGGGVLYMEGLPTWRRSFLHGGGASYMRSFLHGGGVLYLEEEFCTWRGFLHGGGVSYMEE